jgi:hypothetical protein
MESQAVEGDEGRWRKSRFLTSHPFLAVREHPATAVRASYGMKSDSSVRAVSVRFHFLSPPSLSSFSPQRTQTDVLRSRPDPQLFSVLSASGSSMCVLLSPTLPFFSPAFPPFSRLGGPLTLLAFADVFALSLVTPTRSCGALLLPSPGNGETPGEEGKRRRPSFHSFRVLPFD